MSPDNLSPGILRVGLKHSETIVVPPGLTVPEMADRFAGFAEMPPVFATAYLVAFVEWTCLQALAPYLQPGQRTVGTKVELSHDAATPIGMKATAEVELVELDGRRLRFKVACRDARDPIGSGFHERALIDEAKFLKRLAEKAAAHA
ncbi:MAG TPA: thioesterase family protein [Dongiaceae bacterium]|nr:thioesterase family protein [Dongiaceae bacterium]